MTQATLSPITEAPIALLCEPERVSVNIPFSGFYDSIWSQEIDQCATNESEYADQDNWSRYEQIAALAPEYRPDTGWPGLAEALFDHTDYSAAYASLATAYHDAFWDMVEGELGLPVMAKWDGMTRPREYNFETDRLFSTVPLSVFQAMLDALRNDDAGNLQSAIERRHTSRSGFISFYSNDLAQWEDRELSDWDHNELGTLLRAWLAMTGLEDDDRSIDWVIYEDYNMHEDAYHAWSNAVDWEAVERDLVTIAQEKMKEDGLTIADAPYRCPATLELPLIMQGETLQ
jgi:hypothetical protein